MRAGQPCVLCFLDLRKAYDLVPHDRLLLKLEQKGIGSVMLKFIRSLYEENWMRVKVGPDVSDSFKILRGVRQGCPTSPLIFNLFIDDLLEECRGISVPGLQSPVAGLNFADDTVLFADGDERMSATLQTVAKWMETNSMEVNAAKCGVMRVDFDETDASRYPRLKFQNDEIPNVEYYTYLGIQINSRMDLDEMAKHRVRKAEALEHGLAKTLSNPKVPAIMKVLLIKGMLVPSLLYGAEVFGMQAARLNNLKRVLDRAIGRVVGKAKFSRARVHEELNIPVIEIAAAANRARGLSKWVTSHGIISDLIKSVGSQRGLRNPTWVQGAYLWLKRYIGTQNADPKAVSAQVKKTLFKKKTQKNRTNIGRLASKYKLGQGTVLQLVEKKRLASQTGL
ncbi:hypothetical protein PAPHI01_2446 [Pancytospora philotis]|nr:hypothetical protein PAPHI01_2446 [Pancytospora philotis]